MAWTDASTQSAGHLVTADEWNEVINNLKYLKGEDGTVSIEGDIDPSANNSKNLGTYALQWGQGWFNKLYASNGMMTLHRGTVRQETFLWEPDRDHWDVTKANTGNGDYDDAGSGQIALKVLNNAADTAYIAPLAEGDAGFPGQDVSYNAGRSPYGCFPFAISHADVDFRFWIGFRQTLGAAAPSAAAEKYAGLHYNGTDLRAECADGTSETQSAALSALAAATRHVLEIIIISATSVVFAIDGTIVSTLEANLPTGDLDWQVLAISVDTSGADTFYLTIGNLFFQESLS